MGNFTVLGLQKQGEVLLKEVAVGGEVGVDGVLLCGAVGGQEVEDGGGEFVPVAWHRLQGHTLDSAAHEQEVRAVLGQVDVPL